MHTRGWERSGAYERASIESWQIFSEFSTNHGLWLLFRLLGPLRTHYLIGESMHTLATASPIDFERRFPRFWPLGSPPCAAADPCMTDEKHDAADKACAAIPDTMRHLRACLRCKLIKTAGAFDEEGCDNCKDEDLHTTVNFQG